MLDPISELAQSLTACSASQKTDSFDTTTINCLFQPLAQDNKRYLCLLPCRILFFIIHWNDQKTTSATPNPV